MVRRKIYRGINKKGMLLILVLIVGATFCLTGGMPFETFSLGDDYAANVYFTGASFHGGVLYDRNATEQDSIVTMTGPEALIMTTEPVSSSVNNLAITRSDTGYTSLHFSVGNVRSVGLNGVVSDYDPSIIANQRVDGGWNVNTYKLRFGVLTSTMLDTTSYSGLVEGEGPVDYTFENMMEITDLDSWYRTAEINSVELVFNVDIEGISTTKLAEIVGLTSVSGSLNQYLNVETFDVASVPMSYDQDWLNYTTSTVFPTDSPKLPAGGPSVSTTILDTVEGRTTSLEIIVSWAKVAPGVAYHSSIDAFSIYNVISELDVELEIDISANTYDDAKFSMRDLPIIQAPEFSSSYDWLERNYALVIIVFFVILVIVSGGIWYLSKTTFKWVGEGELGVHIPIK